MIMADKTKNCGKGQLTSTDAKELYEAFMRNYEETMEEAGKQIDACLEETFQDRTSSTISDKEECFDEDAAYENYDVVNLSQSTEWRKSVLSSMSVSSWQMQVLPQDMADMLASARTFMSV